MKRLLTAIAPVLLVALIACVFTFAAPRPNQSRSAAANSAAQLPVADGPSIKSDKSDYMPGQIVTLTGTGFKPGEKIAIAMVVDPVTHAAVAINAVADEYGNFTDHSYLVQRSDLGVTFMVVAVGDNGSNARTTFTDHAQITMTIVGSGNVSTTGGSLTGPSDMDCSTGSTGVCSVEYNGGDTVIMTATPAAGFTFTGWTTPTGTVYCTGTTNPCTINSPNGATNDDTMTATFTANTTTTAVTSSLNPSNTGQSVFFTASVAPGSGATVPTGTVQFVVDGSNFGAAVSVSSCSPAPDACATSGATTSLSAATHTVTANYVSSTGQNKGFILFQAEPTTGTTITVGSTVYDLRTSTGTCAAGQRCVQLSATLATLATNFANAVGGSCYVTSGCTGNDPDVTAVANTPTSGEVVLTNTTAGAVTWSASSTTNLTLAPTTSIPAPASAFGNSTGTLSGGQVVLSPTPSTITAVGVGTQSPTPVTAGSSSTYAITTTWAGNLACTSNALTISFTGGTPTGVTTGFSPTTVTNGSTTSVLTISTTGATPAAATAFTVTGSTTASANCGTSSITSAANSLVVNAPRTITAVAVGTQAPNPVNPPNSATYAITATFAGNGTCTSNGLVFNGSLPSGSVASFSPTTVTNAVPTSTLTITTSGTSSASTTPFTVTASTTPGANNCGTSSSNSPSANFVINGNTILTNVVGTQTPNPVISGSSSTYSITTTWSGGAVCTSAPLSINWTAPTGATAVFGPTTVSSTSATSTLTISTTTATPAATTPFTVTAASTGGTGNCGTSSVTSSANSLVVTNRTITATAVGTQQTNPVISGGSSAYTITTTWAGAGTCTSAPLTINWTPAAGETAAFSPTTVTNAAVTSTLTISTTGSTPAGTTPFTVTAATTGGTGSCGTSSITSSSANFVVQTPAGITAVSVGAQAPTTVTPPASATYTVTATWTGGATCTSNALVFNGSLPTGSVASFSPTTVTTAAPTSTLTITSNGTTTPGGTTPFTVTASSTASGTCATGTATSSGSNYVVNPQTILTNVVGTQTPNPVGAGASATFSITTTWSGGAVCTSAPLTINWTAPTGATAVFGPTTVASNAATSTLTISTTTATPAGTTVFTVTAASTGGTGNCGTSSVNSTNHNFVVTTETITATTVGTQTPTPVITGNSATFAITTTWTGGGTCTSIPLAINWSAPAGTTASFSPTTVSNSATTSTLTISTTNGTTPSGSTNFTVTAATTGGTGACGTSSIQSTTHAFVVQTPAVITSVTVGTQSPNPVAASLSATYSVTTTWTGTATCTPIVQINWNPSAPTGVTTSITPAITSVAPSSTLTVVTTGSTPAGTTPFTVTVTSTGGTGGAACGTGTITSSGSNLVVQATSSDNYTQPFLAGHGWTYTQLTCSASATHCTNNAALASPCQVTPCVSATMSDSLAGTQTMTGYFHNTAATTWQTVGVPANATVISVKGSFWDQVTQSGSGCDTSTDTTAGIHIFNAANSAEITTPAVLADLGVDGDTAGVTHTAATAAIVNAGSTASSTGVTLRFDINPSFTGAIGSGTCAISGDSFNLTITYTMSGSGRHGQVIIGFTRTPDGGFRMSTPTYTASPLANADQPNDASPSAIISKRDE